MSKATTKKKKKGAAPTNKKRRVKLEFRVPQHLVTEMRIEVWDQPCKKLIKEIKGIKADGTATYDVLPGTYVVRYFQKHLTDWQLTDWHTVLAE
jgi:hypothetical protein